VGRSAETPQRVFQIYLLGMGISDSLVLLLFRILFKYMIIDLFILLLVDID